MAEAVGEQGFELHVRACRSASLSAVAAVLHDTAAGLAGSAQLIGLCLRDDADTGTCWTTTFSGEHRHRRDHRQPWHRRGRADQRTRHQSRSRLSGRPGQRGQPRCPHPDPFADGPADAFEAARPVFAAFSDTVRLMGSVGAGQLTKLFNNALTITNMKNTKDVQPSRRSAWRTALRITAPTMTPALRWPNCPCRTMPWACTPIRW
ncbi:hypothetical protein O3S80_14765 [Streptomyces sp. Lzd4kr]|nr:hypothetical protein [Streptomyces sp. Lzd4kr]